jgi:hypothetical protein
MKDGLLKIWKVRILIAVRIQFRGSVWVQKKKYMGF